MGCGGAVALIGDRFGHAAQLDAVVERLEWIVFGGLTLADDRSLLR